MSATERQQPPSSIRPTRWERTRDGFTFLAAWGIIGYQMLAVPPKDVNEAFLVLAAGLLGVPFGAEAVARIRGNGGSTTPPEPGSPSPASSPSSP